MKRLAVSAVALTLAVCGAFGQAAWLGGWEGSLTLPEGDMDFSLSIVEGGALIDLPSAQLYGYPSSSISASGASIRLTFAFGGGDTILAGAAAGSRIDGTIRQGDEAGAGYSGSFSMARSAATDVAGSAFAFAGSGGSSLKGTLAFPGSAAKPPMVILHPGLGAADRDGNNYNVPGKNDALRLLAEALQSRGVASYRYDKRGSGASTWLVASEESLSFEAWIRDMAAAAAALAKTGKYSGVWLLGLNDGSIIAAAAANQLAASGSPAAGLVIACASADGPLDAFKKAVSRAPDAERSEGEAIIASLLAGRRVASTSEFYAAAFRPSFQPYLMEAFRHDIRTELARYIGPCLLLQGDMDMQATLADFMALGNARPGLVGMIVPRMNHVLKEVSQDVEDNAAAFSNPDYPLSGAFADAVAGFVNAP